MFLDRRRQVCPATESPARHRVVLGTGFPRLAVYGIRLILEKDEEGQNIINIDKLGHKLPINLLGVITLFHALFAAVLWCSGCSGWSPKCPQPFLAISPRVMAESQSLMTRVSGLTVNLVNPRFVNFNKPLRLAISVALLSFVAFLPVLGYYMFSETTTVTDNSREDVTLITGPAMELEQVLAGYAKLPSACTPAGSDHAYFTGTGETLSSDGRIRTETACDYDWCILVSYIFEKDPDPDKALDPSTPHKWQECLIPDKWLEGFVKASTITQLALENEYWGITGCDPPSAEGTWCPFSADAQAQGHLLDCCSLYHHRQLNAGTECYNLLGPNTNNPGRGCLPDFEDMARYVVARAANSHSASYKICPAGKYRYGQSYGANGASKRDCDLLKEKFLSFKVAWTRNETVTTHTRAKPLDAFASALALTTYIEMVVTVIIILAFRQLGIIKEIKTFTWGEMVNEQQDPKEASEGAGREDGSTNPGQNEPGGGADDRATQWFESNGPSEHARATLME